MVTVLAFDVNETLLDLSPLDGILGGAETRKRWFSQMLQIAFVGGLTGDYVDFPTAQRAALRMLGLDGAERLAEGMRQLPLHPDVVPALDRLGGFTVVALTNSPLSVVTEQLEFNGVASRFDAILSADTVRALKPRAEAYQHVGATLGVPLSEVRLVAAHGWDIAGALAAGCRAAFVRRPGQELIPIGAQPDIIGDDLLQVADALL
ncbi:haloacid dehalogenase type II [Mycobacterium crocinum]|uniref:Haloacid dehalogenase type II n=1 Tax=Mycolicibacterium crocinum TaxID=388459 RepID=A0ABY3TQ09_9MYCO|nr:haloacid dehalogenase type II [Mycolicibacterium crocinum]MCV7217548.1 haloacid dehalogenase type II [Mycolicibacterium crocinum]ULN42426.2 haloacid dehalogenase type II [Mycolicibacterium crocinum]